MNASAAIVAATLRQILGRRRILLFGGLAVFPGLIFFVSSGNESSSAAAGSFMDGVGFHFTLAVPVTALILSAAALGAERRDQTLSFVVLRPISRLTIATSKLVAAFGAAVVLNVAGAVVLAAAYAGKADAWNVLGPLVAGSAIATAVYTAVFLPLGYLSERSTLIGLAYVFVWENGIVGALQVLGITSPWRIGYTAFGSLAPPAIAARIDEFVTADLSLSATTSLVQAAAFVAVSVAMLTWILRTRDLI